MSEIDNNFFCSAGYDDPECNGEGDCIERAIYSEHTCKDCNYLHHKWPTPEQFEKEYGKEYSFYGAVYYWSKEYDCWLTGHYQDVLALDCAERSIQSIRCACTPYGNPDFDWRPKIENV
jgi:hypothetical protein